MAKNIHATIELQGTLGGLVFVHSTKYDKHVRAARGTFKKAPCNKVLRKNASVTALLNAAVSPVYHFFKSYYSPFMTGQVWPELLRCVRRSEKTDLLSLMMTIEGLELNERYTFAKLVTNVDVTVTSHMQKISVDIGAKTHPVFKSAGVNSYYYDIVILFPGEKGRLVTDSISTEWVSVHDEVPFYELVFKKPAKSSCYLLLVKVQGGYNGKEGNSFGMKGVQVVKVGKC